MKDSSPVILKVNEIFRSIQGEGEYTGHPMIFVRLSGCNLHCSYCDTKYHKVQIEMTIPEVTEIIKKYSPINTICWTGGEPTMQKDIIYDVMRSLGPSYFHHLETNGIIGEPLELLEKFDWITVSPKKIEIAEKWNEHRKEYGGMFSIKVVTDLERVGKDMLDLADNLMPLTTFNKKRDEQIAKDVWIHTVKNNKTFSARINYLIWGNRRGK